MSAMGDAAGAPADDSEPVEAVRVGLPCDPTAPRDARSLARDVLGRWRVPELVDPVVLTVSELVTNAVRHGRPPVELCLRRLGRTVRVEVHDGEPSGPVSYTHLPLPTN